MKITNSPILNREGKLPEDGWYHIVPRGEYPVDRERPLAGGKTEVVKVQQVLDDAAMTAMLNRFNEEAQQTNFPGLRVDFDHFSYDTDKSSEAAGWIKQIEDRADGLWAKIEWSDIGQAAVLNKRFKLVSPVWLPKDTAKLGELRIRPLRLDSVALTNNPNLRGMVPLTNRDANASAELTQNPKNDMKLIAAELGLSPDASEETILAEVRKLKGGKQAAEAEVQPMKNRVQELEKANKTLLEAQVDADLAPLKNRVSEEQIGKFRVSLIANREQALPFVQAMIEGLPPAKEENNGGVKDPITNRATAKTTETDKEKKQGKDEEHPFLNRAKKLTEGGKLDFVQAAEQLAKQEPKLFESYMNSLHGITE